MKAKAFIATDKYIKRLRYENPWWISQEIPSGYKNMSKRLYLNLFSIKTLHESYMAQKNQPQRTQRITQSSQRKKLNYPYLPYMVLKTHTL